MQTRRKKIATLVDEFLVDVRANGRSPATLRHYRGRLAPFVSRFGDMQAAALTKFALVKWLEVQRSFPAGHPRAGEPKAADTIRATLIAVKQLQRFAMREGYLPRRWVHPRVLRGPAGGERQRFPSDEEAQRILQAGKPAFRMIFEALLKTGARPGELCQARIEWIQHENGVRYLELRSHKTAQQTGKPRRIPLGRAAGEVFDRSIGLRRSGFVFRRPKGRKWTPELLSLQFRRIRTRLGLDRRMVLYCSRHHFGTKAARGPGGINAAKHLLNHTSIKSTQRYTHLLPEELTALQDAANR